MKGMLSIIFISVVTAVIFMSGGYSLWEKDVTVEGTITVVVPDPETNDGGYVGSINSSINQKSSSVKEFNDVEPSDKVSNNRESNNVEASNKESSSRDRDNEESSDNDSNSKTSNNEQPSGNESNSTEANDKESNDFN